jgi:hypothetical protein
MTRQRRALINYNSFPFIRFFIDTLEYIIRVNYVVRRVNNQRQLSTRPVSPVAVREDAICWFLYYSIDRLNDTADTKYQKAANGQSR